MKQISKFISRSLSDNASSKIKINESKNEYIMELKGEFFSAKITLNLTNQKTADEI